MGFEVYRKKQGVYARYGLAIILGFVVLFASYSLYVTLISLPEVYAGARVPVLNVSFNWGFLSAVILFVICGAFVGILVGGVQTKIGPLDTGARKTVDFLIDTQAELQKVSWPTKQELSGSIIVVIISVIVLSIYIFGVDALMRQVMKLLGFL
ncbi:MAG TPA: preprotein translocase subunit SecE [Candidatus Brocadiia bacterium]|nr:preprotein translocase subunit SecE [Planctomycetota bacterium]MBI4007263.1 preprotein translocase subunit SecE [Planctomycetota bacterium]MDO8092478.1 preprotein translocase subunit SecE [Candidatus Brocadiales bacterium]